MFRSHSNFSKAKLLGFTKEARQSGFDSKITSGEANVKKSAESARSSYDANVYKQGDTDNKLMNTGTSGTFSGRNESISKRKVNQKRQSSKQDQIVILGG